MDFAVGNLKKNIKFLLFYYVIFLLLHIATNTSWMF
jgi:hypothetical protein